mgnify:CR=1 FL=1|tara:strand:+ start:600 stop:800 length:201 start_codon:yes stop_codon:yes gene_type:complete
MIEETKLDTIIEDCMDYNMLEEQVVNTVYTLSRNMLSQTPIESMQSSQAALNLANALAVVDRLTKV